MPDFAQGLPDKNNKGNAAALPLDTVLTLVRQLHKAKRAGTHEDLRIGTPSGLESWALPKLLPVAEGERRLAIPQPVHRWSYKDFEGRLGHGYGEGTVEKLEESPVIIVKNTPNHMMWTRGNTERPVMYDMIRTGNGNWLMGVKPYKVPTAVADYEKEHFRAMPVDAALALLATASGAAATKKIDGAGALAALGKDGIRVFGIRNRKDGSKPEYTDYIGQHMRMVTVPDELQGKVLRGELYGMRQGRAIPPQELSGMLNSTLANAAWKRLGDGTKLQFAATALHEDGTDNYDEGAVRAAVERLGHPAIHTLRRYTGAEAKDIVRAMRKGLDRLTNEGLVVHVPGKRPIKAKLTEDHDVVISAIHPAATGGGGDIAGSFSYAAAPGGRILGSVGSGMSRETAADMLRNKDKYIGRTAKVTANGAYESGALRAPRFIGLRED